MEKHKCKFCFRSFSNGRALGGHVRYHMMNFPLPRKPQDSPSTTVQLGFEAESASSKSSEDGGDNNNNNINDNDEDDDKGVCYGLREKPKRSVRLEDPQFSSVILQDSESETASPQNTTRYARLMREPDNYGSRRTRKLAVLDNCNNRKQVHEREAMAKKMKLSKVSKTESWVVDHEPLSSISDVSTEEDVAFCLMMLSRDNNWKRQKDQDQEQSKNDRYYDEEDQDEDEMERSLEEDSDDAYEEEGRLSKRGRYKCETCNKVFRSYQALGGHRASHKKIKVKISTKMNDEQELENENGGTSGPPVVVEKKIYECPVCFRVFASGQAMGGHKRTHVIGLAAAAATTKVSSSTKHGNNLIDLNFPAPVDDDDISQIENSAVSDAEFVKTH